MRATCGCAPGLETMIVPVYFSPGTAIFSSTVLLSTAICARAAAGAMQAARAAISKAERRRFMGVFLRCIDLGQSYCPRLERYDSGRGRGAEIVRDDLAEHSLRDSGDDILRHRAERDRAGADSPTGGQANRERDSGRHRRVDASRDAEVAGRGGGGGGGGGGGVGRGGGA